MVEGDIFKIKPLGDKAEIVLNKRKLVSPFNSAKSLKYADLPAHCNDCVYRSVDAGGNGKCPKYEEGAVCAIRKDFVKLINTLDTRNPEDLKVMLDMIAKLSFQDLLVVLFQEKMDGNIPGRGTTTQINNILNIIKVINELSSKISVSERKVYTEKGDIESVFRELKARKDDFGR